MSALSIQPTYPIFTETDGLPLENGYIWIGAANLDPQGNPINVYWDSALTISAGQPIRTLNGYPSRNGTPARLYVDSDYSIRVQNSKGSMVYSAPSATERYSDVVITSIDSSKVTFIQEGTGAVVRTAQSKMRDFIDMADFIPVGTNTATTNCSPFLQAAINEAAGREVRIPEGTFLMNTQVSYITSTALEPGLKLIGAGVNKTIFDTRVAGGPMLLVRGGTGGYTFQMGGYLKNFTITSALPPANGDAIEMQSVWYHDIDDLEITDMTRYGIYIHCDVAPGDPDASSYHLIRNCRMDGNGYGIRLFSTFGALGVTNITITKSDVSRSTNDNISMSNVATVNINNCGITGAGANGVVLLPNGVGNQLIFIEENEFGNGNANANCWLAGCYIGTFSRNRMVQSAGEAGVIGLKLGDGNGGRDFIIEQNAIRIDSSINPYSAFQIKSDFDYITIKDNLFLSFGGAGKIKYEVYGDQVTFQEDNQLWGNAVKFKREDTVAASFTPDLNEANHFRVVVSSAGPAFTLNNPLNAFDGRILEIEIVNNTVSGNLSVTFGSAYQLRNYIDPSTGGRSTVSFRYDVTSAVWSQLGAWSYPLASLYTASTPVTSYTPDVQSALHHRVQVNAAGAFTINDPINTVTGKKLELQVLNGSGGAIAVSFGAGYSITGYTNPTNGKRSTASFTYDPITVKYIQIGAWANDFL